MTVSTSASVEARPPARAVSRRDRGRDCGSRRTMAYRAADPLEVRQPHEQLVLGAGGAVSVDAGTAAAYRTSAAAMSSRPASAGGPACRPTRARARRRARPPTRTTRSTSHDCSVRDRREGDQHDERAVGDRRRRRPVERASARAEPGMRRRRRSGGSVETVLEHGLHADEPQRAGPPRVERPSRPRRAGTAMNAASTPAATSGAAARANRPERRRAAAARGRPRGRRRTSARGTPSATRCRPRDDADATMASALTPYGADARARLLAGCMSLRVGGDRSGGSQPDDEVLAVDEAADVGGQHRDHVGDVLGLHDRASGPRRARACGAGRWRSGRGRCRPPGCRRSPAPRS